MTKNAQNQSKRSPLSPAAFSILVALKSGDKHGYAILRSVAEQMDSTIKLLPGTLYNLLKRMLEDGWIEELDERPVPEFDDERRRYYRLTSLGEKNLIQEAETLHKLVQAARKSGVLNLQEQN